MFFEWEEERCSSQWLKQDLGIPCALKILILEMAFVDASQSVTLRLSHFPMLAGKNTDRDCWLHKEVPKCLALRWHFCVFSTITIFRCTSRTAQVWGWERYSYATTRFTKKSERESGTRKETTSFLCGHCLPLHLRLSPRIWDCPPASAPSVHSAFVVFFSRLSFLPFE